MKSITIITPDQSRKARRELGLSQADVANSVGINRQYISEFETGYSNRITTAQLRKLRTFYEGKLREAADNGDEITLSFGDSNTSSSDSFVTIDPQRDLEGIQRTVLAIRHLSIDPNIPQEQAEAILQKIAANDAEAKKLLEAKAENGFFSDWAESTDAMLKEVFGLFAANYVLLRRLQGRPVEMLEQPVEYEQIETVADIFAHLFHAENAPLAAIPADEAEEQHEETEA